MVFNLGRYLFGGSIFKKIAKGIGANAYGQLVSIVVQLASVPLFLSVWSMDAYGRWLIISAIPAYLSMVDFGVSATSASEISVLLTREEKKEANTVFQSAIMFLIIVVFIVFLILLLVAFFFELYDFGAKEERHTLYILIFGVLMSVLCNSCEALYRATDRYPLGTFLINTARLVEWAGWVGGLVVDGSFVAVAAYGLAMRLMMLSLMIYFLKIDCYGLSWGVCNASFYKIKKIVRPAFWYMLFPVSNAINFQGVTLIVGAVLGAGFVVVFNTYRTVVRVLVQITGVFSHSLWPEFSKLYGKCEYVSLERLYEKTQKISLIISFLSCISIYFIMPSILEYWTQGKVAFDSELLLIMLLYAIAGSVWHVPRILLLSTNNHRELSLWVLFLSLTAMILSGGLGYYYGLYGVALSILVFEFFVVFVVRKLVANFFSLLNRAL